MLDLTVERNPYVTGPPISGDRGFYGRLALIREIERDLSDSRQNVVVLPAQRRIGKTTVLHQLHRLLLIDKFAPVNFDIQRNIVPDSIEFRRRFGREIAEGVGVERPSKEALQDDESFRRLFLPQVRRAVQSRRLVVLVDEFDNLAEAQRTEPGSGEPLQLVGFFSTLVSEEPDIAWVFAVGRRTEDLPVQYRSILGKAITHTLERFPREVSDQLLSEPPNSKLRYTPPALERAFELAGGHPYLTQQLGFVLFEQLVVKQGRHTADLADVEAVVPEVLERAGAALPAMVQVPPAERIVLSAVAESTTDRQWVDREVMAQTLAEHRIRPLPEELQGALPRLVEWDLLEARGTTDRPPKYRFAVELIRRWTLQEHPLWRAVQRERDLISPVASEAYERAKQARYAGDLSAAEQLFRTAIRANPVHARARMELGAVLHEQRRLSEALEVLTRAAEVDPQLGLDEVERVQLELQAQLDEAARRVRLALDVGNIGEARQCLDQMLELAPSDPRVQPLETELVVRGAQDSAEQALARGDYDTALRELRRATQLAPENAAVREILAEVQRWQESASLLREAEVAYRLRNLTQAEELVREAARMVPSEAADLQERIPDLQEQIRKAREAEELLAQARTALEGNRLEVVRSLLGAAESLDPESPQIRSVRAILEAEEGNGGLGRLWRQILSWLGLS